MINFITYLLAFLIIGCVPYLIIKKIIRKHKENKIRNVAYKQAKEYEKQEKEKRG